MHSTKFIFLISFIIFASCQQDKAVEVVENFLAETNPQNKMQYVRDSSDYLRNNNISDLLKELPQNYIEIKHSKEIVDDKEIIVEVVIDKISVGGKIVDKTKEFFVFNNNGKYKIDLDASFVKRDTTLERLIRNKISFIKEIRAYVTEFSIRNEKFISNKKVLMWLDDQKNSEGYYIVDESLYESIKSIFSKNSFVHLILQINYLPENDIYIIADSLIQKGWIKNKDL